LPAGKGTPQRYHIAAIEARWGSLKTHWFLAQKESVNSGAAIPHQKIKPDATF